MEILGEAPGRADVTAAVQMPDGAAGQLPQVGAETGGRVDSQQVGQNARPAWPAGWVPPVTRIRLDQQGLGVGAISGDAVGGELVAEDGLGEPVQLQPATDAGQAEAADPPKTAVRRHRVGHRGGQRLEFRRLTVIGSSAGPDQDVGGDGFRGEKCADAHQRERGRVHLGETVGGHPARGGVRPSSTASAANCSPIRPVSSALTHHTTS